MITENLFWALPVLLAALLTSIITRKHKAKERFDKAAAMLQDAFDPQLIFLKHNVNIGGVGSADDIGELLRFGYVHSHLKAFGTFRSKLSTKKKAHIDKVWEEYCYNPNKPDELFFEQYSAKITGKSEKEIKNLTLERINKILKFAEHK